ncbi:MAG: hypothetical protein ISS56_01350 [Anaerolineae bacterium]|nr:hypothetical protein [Anaerolineae bacterium]
MSQDISEGLIAAGVARADVTPPVGIRSIGFAARGPLTALHDPLHATALAISDGSRKAAMVACDLLGLDADTVAEIRAEVHRRTGIAPEHLTVACTHTHYGPDPYRDRSAPDVVAYRANLIYTVAGAVEEAVSRLRSAYLGVGWGKSDIGVNRREKLPDGKVILGQNPGGPIDRAVGVLRVDGLDGTPIACVVNFQTHPVSQASRTDHISADYPGKMRDIVESLTGARCLFLQGACGDINAVKMEPCYEPARTLGTRLGCEVVRIWETVVAEPTQGLAVDSARVSLPGIRYGSEERARELVRSLEAEIETLTVQNAIDGRITWAKMRLQKAQNALDSWVTGKPLPPVETELQAWRLGDLGIATAPGEIFNQIGVAVKERSPTKHTFFVGYANDSIGYVPVPEAYPDGGYEVISACQVDPEAASILTEDCLRLLEGLAPR